jgi:predicted transcriptional regulator
MNGDFNPAFKRILWYVFFATRGGNSRIRIVEKLGERPYNINQLSKELKMDYKTIMHHIKVLEDNKIILPEEKKYGTIYFHTPMFEQGAEMFNEIMEKISKGDKR